MIGEIIGASEISVGMFEMVSTIVEFEVVVVVFVDGVVTTGVVKVGCE
mgnify:CR=1 FL=1